MHAREDITRRGSQNAAAERRAYTAHGVRNREKIFDSWTFTRIHSGPSTEKRSSPATPPRSRWSRPGEPRKSLTTFRRFRCRRKFLTRMASLIVYGFLTESPLFAVSRSAKGSPGTSRVRSESAADDDRYRFARSSSGKKKFRPSAFYLASSRSVFPRRFEYPCNLP